MSEIRQRTVKATTIEPLTKNGPKTVSVDPQRASIPAHVIGKLIFFSMLLFFLPLFTYYYTLNTFFNGNQNYSAISAVVVANLVVFAYVIVAFTEDQGNEDTTASVQNISDKKD